MRKSPLSGLSWLQLIAGALAAMTSAWVASYLGVAGTIIGAAVGSLVASIASALYVRGLDRTTTVITQSGSVVSRLKVADGNGVEESDVAVADEAEEVVEDAPSRDFPWKRVLTWTVAGLATALLVIGGYELATGSSFGNADNPTIGRSWSDDGGSSTQKDDRRDSPDRETAPTPEPSDGATQAPPTDDPTTAPTTPAPTTAPPAEPSPAPTTNAPAAPLDEPE